MARATLATVLCALLLTPLAAALAPPVLQNDAGGGGDAPDSPAAARLVEGGDHDGMLLAAGGDREDWYRVVAPPTTTLLLTFSAEVGGVWGGIHRLDGSLVQEMRSDGETNVLAAPAGVHLIRFHEGALTSASSYAFSLDIRQNDAGSGGDASTRGLAIGPGTYAGALLFGGGDQEDWYTIQAPPTTTLRFTFRATSGWFYGGIHRADDGSMLDNAYTKGDAVTLEAPAGAWRLGIGSHLTFEGTASYEFTVEILQDDAGSGGDAPQAGLPLGPGTYAGALFFGSDNEDWYTVSVPEGTTLRFSFRATAGGFYGGIHRADDGSMLDNEQAGSRWTTIEAPAGEWRLGLGDHLATRGMAAYEFRVELV